jgi:hypothetical protein
MNLARKLVCLLLLLVTVLAPGAAAIAAQTLDIGLAASGIRIGACRGAGRRTAWR